MTTSSMAARVTIIFLLVREMMFLAVAKEMINYSEVMGTMF